ncbi:uncharacterized protein LOC111150285 isoform X2 [Enhydra lutris kenyoni]|uniref:Uncharacterized protein LOC111150285 isoform X2 n=1 Tax=Enhydra lutris kenyoni TaxID=391180 RepID=A0A2Y9JRY1_ENHLU|nr:uncharacterized protein LOC111150285 isoform X2 [Enhydra lutris kenyoni]
MSHDCRASWVEFEHALPVTTWVSLQIRAPIAWKSRRKGCFPHSHCGVGLSQHCLMPLWCDRSAYLSLRLVPAPPKEMEHFNRTEAQHVRSTEPPVTDASRPCSQRMTTLRKVKGGATPLLSARVDLG